MTDDLKCCKGYGIIRFRDREGLEEDEWGVCLCAVGQEMRSTHNTGKTVAPLWQVWCVRNQIPIDRVLMMEDLADEDDLRALFPDFAPGAKPIDAISAIIAAGRGKERR